MKKKVLKAQIKSLNHTLQFLEKKCACLELIVTENYYKNKKTFDLKDHKDLCKILKNIKGKFLLSYNDCELARNLYQNFTIETLETKYRINMQTQNIKRKELLVRNYWALDCFYPCVLKGF